MIVKQNQRGYERQYVYGGTNFFGPIVDLIGRTLGKAGSKAVSTITSKAAQDMAKHAAKKVATDVGKAALQKGSEKVSGLVSKRIDNLIAKKKNGAGIKII